MTGQTGSFFLNRFLLTGLSIPVFLHLINGLNLYYPTIPSIPTLFLAGPYFSDSGILTGFQKLKIYLYPSFIGFAFLTSRQISFSFWFFFLGGCLLYGILNLFGYSIPVSELGVTFGPTLARPEEMQMIGAYGIFFLFLVWLARLHLLDVCRQSLFLTKPVPGKIGMVRCPNLLLGGNYRLCGDYLVVYPARHGPVHGGHGGRCFFYDHAGGNPDHLPGRACLLYPHRCPHRRNDCPFRNEIIRRRQRSSWPE